MMARAWRRVCTSRRLRRCVAPRSLQCARATGMTAFQAKRIFRRLNPGTPDQSDQQRGGPAEHERAHARLKGPEDAMAPGQLELHGANRRVARQREVGGVLE